MYESKSRRKQIAWILNHKFHQLFGTVLDRKNQRIAGMQCRNNCYDGTYVLAIVASDLKRADCSKRTHKLTWPAAKAPSGRRRAARMVE